MGAHGDVTDQIVGGPDADIANPENGPDTVGGDGVDTADVTCEDILGVL